MMITDAKIWVDRVHRHLGAPQGGLFAIGLARSEEIVGVVIVGRPIARLLQDGWTAEVMRLAVIEGVKNGCWMLYGAAWRAARVLGYRRRRGTYTLQTEPGTNLANSPEPDQLVEEHLRTGSGNPNAANAPKCPSSLEVENPALLPLRPHPDRFAARRLQARKPRGRAGFPRTRTGEQWGSGAPKDDRGTP